MKRQYDLLSKKQVVPILVTGSSTNGSYNIRMSMPIKLDENATHKIYLKSFSAWQNIPKIKNGLNVPRHCFLQLSLFLLELNQDFL